MDILCTRPSCPRPFNAFDDLDNNNILKTVQQKYCTACGMPLILAGRYLPVKLLGKGGFGAAYKACDRYTPTMRTCVVKQFQPSGDLSLQQLQIAQQLFEREAIVLEELGNQHPQIPDLFAFFPLEVQSLQAGKSEQLFYLVQEFVDGKNLEEELAQKDQFAEAEILEILIEILKILKFVHEHHSIHRDIKPANIMRHKNGRLYLLDFGAVKQVTQAASGNIGRSTGIYSMGFAPPEQMTGSTVFPSTDLYALAVTCIILLTGKMPTDLFDSYKNEWNWRSFTQVSNHLANVLDRMLQLIPSQRYQSAQEVLTALETPSSPTIAPHSTSHSAGTKPTPTVPAKKPVKPPPVAMPVKPPPITVPAQTARTPNEILNQAALTGFEGALLWVSVFNLLNYPGLSYFIWLALMAGVVFGQYYRLLGTKELIALTLVNFIVMIAFPMLRGTYVIPVLIIHAGLAGLAVVALTAIIRIFYK
jgi:serine/threonine protein kinase